VLERLANEAAGAWVLAKVDVDANPQLSAALQVQSIPMVLAVIGGQLAPGFLGALPEAQVREWLGQVTQVAQQLGLPGASGQPAEGPEDDADSDGPAGLDELREPELAEAQQAMERGDLDAAAGAFEQMLANSPGHPVATVGLAQVNLFRRVNSYDAAKARKDAAARPDDVAAQIRVADIEMSLGNAEEAFDRLLGVIRRTTGEDRNKVRQHLVSLFEIFPARDPRVTKARGTLSSLLF
jgi:putative thioredoxin